MMPLKQWYGLGIFSWSEVVHVAAETDDPVPVAFLLDTRLRSRLLRFWVLTVSCVLIGAASIVAYQIPLTPPIGLLCSIWLVIMATAVLCDAQLHWLLSKRHDLKLLANKRYRLSFFLRPASWWTIHIDVAHEELIERVLIVAGHSHLLSPRLQA